MTEKRYPTREEIDKADDRPWEDVPAPELGEGCVVRVGVMSAADRDSWEVYTAEHGQVNATAALLVRCLIDPITGQRLYRDDEAEALGAKGHHWQTRAWPVAIRLNAIRRDSVEVAAGN
jgi:hypothetical protein